MLDEAAMSTSIRDVAFPSFNTVKWRLEGGHVEKAFLQPRYLIYGKPYIILCYMYLCARYIFTNLRVFYFLCFVVINDLSHRLIAHDVDCDGATEVAVFCGSNLDCIFKNGKRIQTKIPPPAAGIDSGTLRFILRFISYYVY